MSELLRFQCPTCGKRLKAAVEHAGRKARCRCGDEVFVPGIPVGAVTAPAGAAAEGDHWSAEPPTITTLRPAPAQVSIIPVTSSSLPTWQSILSGTPEYSFELRYRGNIQEMWQAILEYVHKLPDLTILLRSESPLQLTYQSKHFRQIIVVNLSSAVQPGEANIVIHVFDDTSQPASGDQQVPATRLFAYAALKTQALDQNFRQTSGAGGPAEARWGGVWKMGGGAALLLLGLNLTAATNGKVLFYGAIVWGAILLLTGVVQTVMGRNVE